MGEANDADALRSWPARLDVGVKFVGGTIAAVGAAVQWAGLVVGLELGDPVTGEHLITIGLWAGMAGGAGLVYGLQLDAGGKVRYHGGPVTYTPPKRRRPAAVWSVALAPLWGVLSLPIGTLMFGLLLFGACVFGSGWVYKRMVARS